MLLLLMLKLTTVQLSSVLHGTKKTVCRKTLAPSRGHNFSHLVTANLFLSIHGRLDGRDGLLSTAQRHLTIKIGKEDILLEKKINLTC
jgi:hypothetical protein